MLVSDDLYGGAYRLFSNIYTQYGLDARGVQTHGSIPKPMLDKLRIDERLLRLSVGLENAEDLIADLEQAIG